MSRQHSRSPRYRRFPWEEPDFDPCKVLAHLDGNPLERGHRPREEAEEHYFREGTYPDGQRRSLPFPMERHFGHQRHPDQEEFYRRRTSPHHHVMGYGDQRLSPLRPGGDGDRHRGGFRENFQSFENRGGSSQSPPRLARERLPPIPRSYSDHHQRETGMGWRAEEQGRGRGRFRDLSPRSDDKRGGTGRDRGTRNAQGSKRDRRREEPHQSRNHPFKSRREMDGTSHLGYRNEENFGDQPYSVDTPRDGYGGDAQGNVSHMDVRHLAPLVIEHDHGITDSRELPRWEQFEGSRGLDPDFNRRRSPHPTGSSQARFRTSHSRLNDQEDSRGGHFQNNWRDPQYHEARSSPMTHDRPNLVRYGNRDGPMNQKGRGGPRPPRGRLNHGPGGRAGLPKNQSRLQQTSQGFQNPPHEEQRPGFGPFRDDYADPIEGNSNWAEGERLQQWEHDRPGNLEEHLQRDDLDPKILHQREHRWNDPKTSNVTVTSDETLTIKVDTSRPTNQNSLLSDSSERQLSLDLVNVGRQRLDFLPMLEHSGTYRETPMHSGTFVQEIITLVHQVREQYFRNGGVPLNERFSALPKAGHSEEATEELTLDERFSSSRGFSLNISSLLDDDEPLFSRPGSMQGLSQQPVRSSGDLRHDLDRRRQERLEGVKVTIPGNNMALRPLESVSEMDMEYGDKDDMEDKGFTSWSEDHNRRREGNVGPRRGAPFRLNVAQRRNDRAGNRPGQMRRQNNRSNPAGPTW
ncbi:BCLAF1 and THRAP3 family member 3 [Mastacembelus armatus]|uniref:BCLAF1 and THRAP3 family member 3 n=1 Tax=Mastacembelus armatus TaxID=205130 RepID=UPI000E45B967|nr:BCLAF1 and THRAP3 family member 3-like [Mastacembelus armatus]